MSVLVTVGFFAMLYLVLNKEVPDGSRDLTNILLGQLGGAFAAVCAYWVGSSAGSAAKDHIIRQIAGK